MMLLDCLCGNLYSLLSEWITATITFFGFLIALWQFRLYRKELRNKTFIEFRQRFKSDVTNLKVLKFLVNDNEPKPTKYDVYHFLGFYEELHKMLIDKQVSAEDLIYFFGYYYINALAKPEIKGLIELNNPTWSRANALYNLIKENQNAVFEKINNDFKK